jgi:hypothetical protein
MASLPNASVLRSSLGRSQQGPTTKSNLELVDADGIGKAMRLLRAGRYDRYIEARHMRTLEQAGYVRAGKVDWNRVEALVRRADVFAMLRNLAVRILP